LITNTISIFIHNLYNSNFIQIYSRHYLGTVLLQLTVFCCCCADIDECESGPCEHGDCTDLIDGYVCACHPGWTGENCASSTAVYYWLFKADFKYGVSYNNL